MQSLLSFLLTVMILMCPMGSMAGQIYHWIDKNGHDHITEEPPPSDGRLREVIEYTPQPEEMRQPPESPKQPQQISEAKTDRLLGEVTVARRQAAEARIKAQETQAIAEELNRRADEFKANVANTNRRRQKNRSITVRLENDALQAQQLADQAAEEARQAEERALQIEKKAAVKMIQQPTEQKPAQE